MINNKSNNDFKIPWIIGHRGFRARYPENTLIAFQAAIEAGVRMIELDVMLSRDRKVVVIHDATVDRTTDGKGPVDRKALEELKQLDAGGWFDAQFSNQRIPELSEVLDLVAGRVYVNIEIKSNAFEAHHPADAIEMQVVDLLKQKKLLHTSLVSSFNIDIIKQIAALEKPPEIAFISEEPASTETVQMCTRLNLFSWHPNYRIVSRNQVKQMHAAGLKVFPYTVNSKEDYTRMRSMDVDGIVTDDPASAAEWSLAYKAE